MAWFGLEAGRQNIKPGKHGGDERSRDEQKSKKSGHWISLLPINFLSVYIGCSMARRRDGGLPSSAGGDEEPISNS